MQFHIEHFSPIKGTLPNGGWSLYRITGDQIAERIEMDDAGKVKERHSWCGYIGCYATLPDCMAAIERESKL